MAAEDQRFLAALGPLFDPPQRRRAQFALHQVLEIAIDIVAGGRVAKKDIALERQYGRERGQPTPLRTSKRVERVAIGRPHARRIQRQHLPLVIAADGRQAERHQALGGLVRQERTRDDVAQIHDEVHPAALDVAEHGVQSEEISVYVGDGRYSHTLIEPPATT